MAWLSDIPPEGWAIGTTILGGFGTQVALLLKWRREDKLRIEQRESAYIEKIQSVLGTMIQREKEYTISLLEHSNSTVELKMILTRVVDMLEDVAQVLKDFTRKGP